MFDRQQRGPAPLAAGREALEDPQQGEQDRCGHADHRVVRQQADERGRGAHEDEREDEHLLPPDAIAEVAGDDRPERPEEERDAQRRPGHDLAERRTVRGQRAEVLGGEDEAGGLGVDEEVVPLDGRADEGSGEDLAFLVGHVLCGRAGSCGGHCGSFGCWATLPCA